MSAADYWIDLYAQAELDTDDEDLASPDQGSELGRQYYYLEDVAEDVAS